MGMDNATCSVCAVGAVLRSACGVEPLNGNAFATRHGDYKRVADEEMPSPIDASMPANVTGFEKDLTFLPRDIPWLNYLSVVFEKACLDLQFRDKPTKLKLKAIRLEMVDFVNKEFPDFVKVEGV